MKKFNKKLLVFGLPLFALVLVSGALLQYFGLWTGIFAVTQAVTVEDGASYDGVPVAGTSVIDCDDGTGYWVKNNADVTTDVKFGTTCENSEESDDGIRNEVEISWDALDGDACNGITTNIYGILKLTKKNVVFGTSPWTIPEDAETAIVHYTLVGETFSAEVVEGIISGYELIYYSDNFGGRFANPAQAIRLDGISESLPYADDENLDEYNYCSEGSEGESYEHCYGAKLWYVPTGALLNCLGNVCDIDWSRASEFLFETDLITYSETTSNVITLPANGGGFSFCVENDFASGLVGDTYTVESQILPA